MRRVLLLFVLAFALDAHAIAATDSKVDAPPPNISPTTATLSQILKHYTEATGRLAPGTPDTRQESWAFSKEGLAGTETLVRSGSDYRSRIAAGPLVDEYGQFLGHGWHRDQNGVVSPVASPDYTSFEMMLFMRNFDEAADPKNDVTVLGEVQDPKPAYVLQIKVTGYKHPDFAFYDKETGLIDRFVSIDEDGSRTTLTYGDYRATDGLEQPWHIHSTDGTAALDYDFVRQSLEIGKPIPASSLAIPNSTFTFETYSGHQSLPANVVMDDFYFQVGDVYHEMSSPTFIVRLNVGGRGLDFALSAGQPYSLIDFDVAQQLQLPSYGQVTHAGGDDVSYDTILPQADLGNGLSFHNWALRATPFHYHANDATKVVGLIGYDVLSTGVFKIDFVNGKLDVFPAAAFDGDGPPEVRAAYQLPITFDSGVPFFSAILASHVTHNVMFDNDFEMSYVFGSLTSQYPDAFKDVDTGKTHGTATIPFADSKGYGKKVSVWATNVPDISIGPARFTSLGMAASDGDIDIAGHQIDAVMGGDLLRFYDIYLDYPHNRVFLKPNSWFFKAFKVVQPK